MKKQSKLNNCISRELNTRLHTASEEARNELLARRTAGGTWSGHLSSSALSTAVAVTALAVADPVAHRALIGSGLAWLEKTRNDDGGWGDTPESPANLSTTLLCWSAFAAAGAGDVEQNPFLAKTEEWLTRTAGGIEPDMITRAVLAYYGKDRTFSVPILMMCCLAGRLGELPQAWNRVPPLPFELAILPHGLYAALRLPVVSYALPALIAIGHVTHVCRSNHSIFVRFFRGMFMPGTLKKLEKIQPGNGGFLEAAPLTGFVVMSLITAGYDDHAVALRGIEFLKASARQDGSWPIDTNLSTWVTTLAINALNAGDTRDTAVNKEDQSQVVSWLIDQQYDKVHPYTNAAPGGWAWTPLPGGVPDADDTSGALCMLREMSVNTADVIAAASNGITWLLNLQNSDGGIPTFCRGWGTLPFDRSCPDITAHAIHAWMAWRDVLPSKLRNKIDRAITRGTAYLADSQRGDGAWLPLWFGNQYEPNRENPVYGTARVLTALAAAGRHGLAGTTEIQEKGSAWLCSAQNRDGSWGGDIGILPTIEETALAVRALAETTPGDPAVKRGIEWLLDHTQDWQAVKAAPIGLYFASLWYDEELYPLIFTVAAFESVQRIYTNETE
jgi:squalene-hopene/tetraprenyl-beta-curcumene cyclase